MSELANEPRTPRPARSAALGGGLRRRVAGAAAVSLGGGAVGAVANLLLALIVGRALGAAGAGPFFQILAFVAIASNVLELGADTGLVRQVSAALALERGDKVRGLVATAVMPVVAVTILVCGLGWLLTPWVSRLFGGSGPGWVLTLLAASGLAALLAVVLGAVRALFSAVPFTLVQNIGLPVGRLALVGLVVVAGATSWRPVTLAWLVPLPLALLAAVLLLWRGERRHRGSRPALDATPAERREFWAFSGPRGLSAAAEICLEWADVLIVAALCTPAEAGIYAVVTRCARSGELVQQAARVAIGPIVSAALARGEHGKVRQAHRDVSIAMAALSWPCFAIAGYFAPELLGLFGADFREGATALRVLCVAMALSYAAGSVQSILLMGGRSTVQLGNKVGCLVVNVGLNLALVPTYGILGAAVAWGLVLVLDAALAWLQILIAMRLRLPVGPGLCAGALLAAVAVAASAGSTALLSGRTSDPVLAPVLALLVVGAAVAIAAVVVWRRPARRGSRLAVAPGSGVKIQRT
ncbi:lipopolysaccharide biosynthesis protein [Nocardioides sp.]|uniref:lipopolysaccharide biosynthesis protein n=1 Tax=Nocardioides sp. TaxID=35761 RepID=UPI0039E3825E